MASVFRGGTTIPRAGCEYVPGYRFNTGSIEEAACGGVAGTREACKHAVTANVLHMVRMLDDPAATLSLYQRAWVVHCDSRELSRLAWLYGRKQPAVAPPKGPDANNRKPLRRFSRLSAGSPSISFNEFVQ